MTAITRGASKGWFHSRRVWLLGLLVLVALAFPVGLHVRPGAGSATMSAGSAPAGPGPELGTGAASPDRLAKGAAPAPQGAADAAPAEQPVVGPKVARSAWLGIKVSDLVAASGTVRSVTTAAGGQVLSENVVTSPDPTGGPAAPDGGTVPVAPVGVDEARLTVRVPAGALDSVMTELSKVGTVSYRSSQSEDLTDSYVDTKARIGPMRDAVAQVRALLVKATNLSQVIQLENEVTRRQADLDSLESRLATLERRTTTSDVTVSLWTSATPAAPAPGGFVGQLRDSWTALLDSVAVILTGLAVLLPWLVLLTVAVLVGRRWWSRRAPAPTPSAPGPAD